MSRSIEFLEPARSELKEATRFYELRVRGLGKRFRTTVEKVCAEIAVQPLLWNVRPGDFRRVNVPGFLYFIAYLIQEDRIVIMAVGHASRDPDYWKERLP